MSSLISSLLSPPIFEDEDKTRVAGLLHIILGVIFAGAALYAVAIGILNPERIYRRPLLGIVLLMVIGIFYIMRRGRVRLASLLICVGLWLTFTLTSITTEGLYSPVSNAYIIVILISGLLLGGRAPLIFAGLSVAAGLGMLYTLRLDPSLSPTAPFDPTLLWAVQSIYLVVAGAFLFLAARSVNSALERARRGEGLLAEQNRALWQEITDHRQTTQALRESEQRLRLAAGASNTGLWDWDLRTNQVYFSPEWKRQLGYEEHELENRFEEWANRLHPDDHDRATATVRAYLEDPWPDYENEFRLRHKDGSYRWILTRADLLRDEQGKPHRMLGSHVDITERKQAEAELRRSEEQFSKIFHNNPLAIVISRVPDATILDANDSFLKLMGYGREEIIGHTSIELNMWADPQARSNMAAMMGEQRIVRDVIIDLRTKSGELRTVLAASMFIELSSSPGVVTMLHDITERQQAEEALRRSEARFSRIFHSSPVAAYIIRLEDSRVLDANDDFLALLGYDREEVIGRTSHELRLFADPDDRTRLVQKLRENGSYHNEEFQVRTRSGEIREVLASAELMELDGQQCVVGMSQDITERKRAEAETRAAELLRVELEKERELIQLKERFISVVSHEFRTPLSVIMSSAELVQRYSDRMTPERQLEHVQDVLSQAQFMVTLLDDVLTVNKARAGRLEFKPTPMNLKAFCEGIAERIRLPDNGRHQMVLRFDGQLENVVMDSKLLQHILVNLLSNAIKYSPDAGEVRLEVLRQNDEVILRVSDQGIGIPPESQARLFEPFHRADNVGSIGGTGLGLAIVKESVDLHRGSIHCESEVGVGTIFTVRLPT